VVQGRSETCKTATEDSEFSPTSPNLCLDRFDWIGGGNELRVVHNWFMETVEEIEAQLRNLPKGVDPIKAAASEIHHERRAHEGTQRQLARTQGELGQCSVTVGKQNERLIEQNRTIKELRVELAELRAKNPT
jgi:predicted RNase H-like nuclease (RuvC/YqgF family)